jgi:hypothetical protein
MQKIDQVLKSVTNKQVILFFGIIQFFIGLVPIFIFGYLALSFSFIISIWAASIIAFRTLSHWKGFFTGFFVGLCGVVVSFLQRYQFHLGFLSSIWSEFSSLGVWEGFLV